MTLEYDIIYSIGCHESVEAFLDTLRNINYFNRQNKICIIVNPNHIMNSMLKNRLSEFSNIFVYPEPSDKKRGSYGVVYKTHVQNFNYCRENSIISKYFILLASNCYFLKDITVKELDNLIENSRKPPDIVKNSGWLWPRFLKNKKINTALASEGCKNLYGSQHEGALIEYDVMNKISDITEKHNFEVNVVGGSAIEEYLFASLYAGLTNKMMVVICKVFWSSPGYTPSLNQFLSCPQPIAKRVARNNNNIIRVTMRKKTNNYSLNVEN